MSSTMPNFGFDHEHDFLRTTDSPEMLYDKSYRLLQSYLHYVASTDQETKNDPEYVPHAKIHLVVIHEPDTPNYQAVAKTIGALSEFTRAATNSGLVVLSVGTGAVGPESRGLDEVVHPVPLDRGHSLFKVEVTPRAYHDRIIDQIQEATEAPRDEVVSLIFKDGLHGIGGSGPSLEQILAQLTGVAGPDDDEEDVH